MWAAEAPEQVVLDVGVLLRMQQVFDRRLVAHGGVPLDLVPRGAESGAAQQVRCQSQVFLRHRNLRSVGRSHILVYACDRYNLEMRDPLSLQTGSTAITGTASCRFVEVCRRRGNLALVLPPASARAAVNGELQSVVAAFFHQHDRCLSSRW